MGKETFDTAGGDVSWCYHDGSQCGVSSKNK